MASPVYGYQLYEAPVETPVLLGGSKMVVQHPFVFARKNRGSCPTTITRRILQIGLEQYDTDQTEFLYHWE